MPRIVLFYLVTGLANGMQKVKVFNAGGRISCGTFLKFEYLIDQSFTNQSIQINHSFIVLSKNELSTC